MDPRRYQPTQMKLSIIVLPVVLLLTGCVNFMRTPPDLAHIQRERVNSGKVAVRSFEILRVDGEILLTGKVGRLSDYADTSRTHLDVILYAADGAVIRSIPIEFSPRQIGRGHRFPGRASYRMPLDPLPPDVARIEVRAHDSEHPAS